MGHSNPVVLLPLEIGLLCLCFGIWQFVQELAPRKWSRLPGTIVSLKTVKQAITNGRYQLVPMIKYQYNYGDQIFESSHRRYGNYLSGNFLAAENVASQYAVGDKVTVLVNPRNPAKSVLEYGTSPLSWIPFILGILFTTVGIAAAGN